MAFLEGQRHSNSLLSVSHSGIARWLLTGLIVGLILGGVFFALGFYSWQAVSASSSASLDLSPPSRRAKNLYFSQQREVAYQPLPEPKEANPPKKIVVDISSQRFYCYEGDKLVKSFLTSTGKSSTPTKLGSFKILDKYPIAYGGVKGQRWTMPYWLGIYYAGGVENGIHALPYINGVKESMRSLGHRVSHGCIRLKDSEAKWVYEWSEIGTPVIIQW